MGVTVINIASDFTRYPAGRFRRDGRFSGEQFRDDMLIPALERATGVVVVDLDGTIGYGSSFLEEAFGGLMRKGYSSEQLRTKLQIRSADESLVREIQQYLGIHLH